jgi:hypothetical protein
LRQGSYFPSSCSRGTEPRSPPHGCDPGGLRAGNLGISTRSVDDLVKALGTSGVSMSQVSRLCGEVDERVEVFLNRPIERPAWRQACHQRQPRGHLGRRGKGPQVDLAALPRPLHA